MLTKRIFFAIVLTFVIAGCRSLPWSSEKPNETNVAFKLVSNQPVVAVTVNGVEGRFLLGTAHIRTVFSTTFEKRLLEKTATPFRISVGNGRASAVDPVVLDLQNLADGILGVDAFKRETVTIDYQRKLITFGKSDERPFEGLQATRFAGPPSVAIRVEGKAVRALLDTTIPDTIILPGAESSRKITSVEVAGRNFPRLNGRVAPVSEARLGTGILSSFLVTIDYRNGKIALSPR